MGRSWGTALTGGLAACALGLAGLLGTVLHFTARPPARSSVSLHERQQPRSVPTRTREGERDKAAPKEHPPPVRLWRGPTPEKHPPRPRRALA